MAKQELEIVVKAKDLASGVFSAIGGVGLAGITALGAGLGFAAKTGLDFNNAMEQASARINAFTKDGAATADILEMIRDRAAQTPFEFQEMTNAAANLLPVVKESGVALEELISQAEILAASNPAQGLEGAAFALKEALSGDFVSIVERFNLPRKFINDLKEQGVPAMEIVSQAMAKMGLDTSLVSNLAETAEGRWSTFKDTLVGLAGTVTQPIFDSFSSGLGGINEWLSANEGKFTAYAEEVSAGIGRILFVLEPLLNGEPALALQNFQVQLLQVGFSPEQVEGISGNITSIVEDAQRAGEAFGKIFSSENNEGASSFAIVLDGIAWSMERIAAAAETASRLKEIFNTLGGAGGVDAIVNEATGFNMNPVQNIAAADQFLKSDQMSRQGLMNAGGAGMLANVATGGLSGIGQGMGFDVNALVNQMANTLGPAIASALQSAPPPPPAQVTVQLDSDPIAARVQQRIGTQAAGLRRVGGAAGL